MSSDNANCQSSMRESNYIAMENFRQIKMRADINWCTDETKLLNPYTSKI